MYRCERCGAGFNPVVAANTESCPRCKAAGIDSRLSFKLFEKTDPRDAPVVGVLAESGDLRPDQSQT